MSAAKSILQQIFREIVWGGWGAGGFKREFVTKVRIVEQQNVNWKLACLFMMH